MPKTYTTKIIGYEFTELSDDIQKDWYEKDKECLEWDADECYIKPLVEGFQDDLDTEYGATDIEVNYDLSYGQGDGCSFTAFFDVDTMLRNLDFWQDLIDDLNSGLLEIDDIRVERCGSSNYYCHEHTCTAVIEWSCNAEYREDDYNRLQELVDLAEGKITDEIRDKLRDLTSILYRAYEEGTSFKAYQEYMSIHNNLRYTELGEIIPPDLIKDAIVVDGVQLEIPGLFESMGMEEIELPSLDVDSDTDTLDLSEDSDELYSRDMSKDRQTYI